MTQILHVHPKNPQLRLIHQAVASLRAGALIVYPTDSSYALGCSIGDKHSMERIRRLRQIDEQHHFTLVCRDLKEIATYARVDNSAYRFLRAYTPGPYTFLLQATREVPRRMQHPKRKTIGVRVPGNIVAQTLLAELNAPLVSSTLHLPGDEYPVSDIDDLVYEKLRNQLELILEGGGCGMQPTTVIDLLETPPTVIRQGKGEFVLGV